MHRVVVQSGGLLARARAALEALRRAKPFTEVPLARVDALHTNSIVRVVGTVRPAGALVGAPCSGRRCVAYELTVRHTWTEVRWLGGLRVESFDERLLGEQGGRELIVETPDGSVLVPWSGDARLRLRPSQVFVRSGSDIPADWTRILERLQRRRDFGRRQARFIASRLESGAQVAVIGRVGLRKEPSGAGAGYRSSPTRWLLLPTDDGLIVTNERGALR